MCTKQGIYRNNQVNNLLVLKVFFLLNSDKLQFKTHRDFTLCVFFLFLHGVENPSCVLLEPDSVFWCCLVQLGVE